MKRKLLLLSCFAAAGLFPASRASAQCCQCDWENGDSACADGKTEKQCVHNCKEKPFDRCYFIADGVCNGAADNECIPAVTEDDLICVPSENPIPTVSEWGLVVMTLLGLTVGTIIFARRRARGAPSAG